MDVWGSRRFRVRVAVALAGVAAVAIAMGACGFSEEPNEPEAIVERFTELLDEQDYGKAAELTSYPNAASATLKQMFEGLAPGTADYEKTQFIDLDGQSALFSMDVGWNFGEHKDWRYSVQGTVRKLAIGWRISWEPAVVMPDLTGSRTVKLVRTTPKPPPRVIDIVGEPLMTEQIINVIKLDPSRIADPVASTDALAAAIEPVAPLITGESLREQLANAEGAPITAVNLREGDFAILEPRMAPIPGVVMEKQPRLIAADRRVWSPQLDALRKVWEASQEQHSGWGVQIFEADGRFVGQVAGYQGPPGPDIAATMDQRLQRAAEDAVVSVGTPASIVAIQPSNGAVVAVAQNSYATEQGPISFTGLYPIGGNIELLRAVAAAKDGKAPQDVSVQEAAEAAPTLGIGLDVHVPGLDEVTGRLAIAGRTAEQVRQGGGSDAVLASPFGMAIAAASIARGGVPAPMIEAGRPASTDAELTPFSGELTERLRMMLREGMAAPDLAPLRSFPVIAYAAPAGSDGWLIANMGDLAFAIHISEVDSGNATARMAARMLQALAKPET
ncbi:penicillin-binding protein [Nocardia puris]|uniref:beta-lactamase n=1 Tax=Nocardia puris TaxID=208602 RepID=A0A366DN20_9NOCA|nr:penicillin-binding protein [Nocardia puris]MBF6365593.1 penicillin-binding protein [Nocardia puris]MBF6460059.1 penicillin-binding protein [Nocardia puris]RBO91456.1 MecA-like transpeptidase family protein [Nocardia puris]